MIGKRIYVAGGLGKDGELAVLEIFDAGTGKWEKGPDMPGPVAYCASCNLGGKLFVFGGSRGKEYLSEVVSFNPETVKWQREKPLDFAREESTATILNGRAYIMGGRASAMLLPAFEVYKPVIQGDDGAR